jgi:integrase
MPLSLKAINGVWHIHGTVAGRRIRQSAGTRDKAVAENIRAELEARLFREKHYGREKETTFAEAAEAYMLAGGSTRYLAPLIRAVGKERLANLNGVSVKRLAKKLYPAELKPQTLNRYVIKPVSAVLHFAHEAGLGPAIKIRGFASVPTKPKQAASQEWVAKFVHACDEQAWPYIGTYALFLHVTADRPSEAIVLGPKHLDLDRKVAVSEPTKTGTFRIFHLTDELVRRFRIYPAKELQWGRSAGEHRLFGYADTKGPVPIWKAICEKAGIPYFSPYPAGRKSFATTLISKRREDVKTAAEIGNWRDVRVLLEHYVVPDDMEEFVRRNFEGLLARNWQAPNSTTSQVVENERKKA